MDQAAGHWVWTWSNFRSAGTYKELSVAELESGDGPVGAAISDRKKRALISIKDSLVTHEPEVMVAVMAHELAHVLLLGDGKISRDLDRMEPLTDLMTVFCGFGVLSANAAHIYDRGRQARHGYLSQREYGYALAVWSTERGEKKPQWERELTKNVRVFLRMSLACLKAEA